LRNGAYFYNDVLALVDGPVTHVLSEHEAIAHFGNVMVIWDKGGPAMLGEGATEASKWALDAYAKLIIAKASEAEKAKAKKSKTKKKK